MSGSINFRPHSAKQERVIFSDSPITVAGTGTQWGKTQAGAHWLQRYMHTFTAPDDNFIIAAPTYKIMQQSSLPTFLPIMSAVGKYSKADAVFKMHGGGTCYMRTGTDPDSIVGIPRVRAIWGDEAGLFSLYFWENILARAGPLNAPVMLTTSPYTLNWIYKQIIRPKLKDPAARPDCLLVQATSIENPHYSRETWERNQRTMDPRRFNALFGGQWDRMTGLVYDCFDETENQCQPFTLPTGTRIVGGIDWGWTDPFVFKVRAITPQGYHFGIHEYYRTGQTISDIVGTLKGLCKTLGVSLVYCGPDQPGHIEELNRAGIRAVPADNSIRLGIDRHYELLKTRRLKYFSGENPHTLDELETYHYPEPVDAKPDKSTKDLLPVGQNDHCLDCDRYITMMTYNASDRRAPVVPDEKPRDVDQFARLERLKRAPRTNQQTERWT